MGNSATKLPYNPGTKRVTGYKHYDGIWQVFVGDDGQTLIFRHDKKGAKPQDTACAQNALKRLRSLRHPYILKLLVRALGTAARLCATAFWKFLTPLFFFFSLLQRTRAALPPTTNRMAWTMRRRC